jgi:hypothetical protein
MATELETSVRSAAQKLANALERATELVVETQWVEVGDEGAISWDDARPLSKTVITLGGDTTLTIPMTRTEGGSLQHDTELLGLHMRNVQSAIDYRNGLLAGLLTIIGEVRTR